MVCYSPLVALDDPKYKLKTESQRLRIVGRFSLSLNIHKNFFNSVSVDEQIDYMQKIVSWTIDPDTGEILKPVLLPCGKCIGCRLAHSREWAIRCEHEAKMHESNRFVTLTYDKYSLPRNGTLVKKDVQLFIKNLRKEFGDGIKYFISGEYGSKLQRPHYHLILFGVDFGDEKKFKKVDGYQYNTSDSCLKLWKKGHILVGDVNFASAAYVSRYCTKKIYGDLAYDHYGNRISEFQLQSLRPGIGSSFFKKYYKDIYQSGIDKCITSSGLLIKPPRYYDKLLENHDLDLYNKIKENRLSNSLKQFVSEITDERRFAKKTVQEARFQKLIRIYESEE